MNQVPQNVSESTRKRNPHLYGDQDGHFFPDYEESPPKKRIRQSSKPLMNRLESRFIERLRTFYPSIKFHAQAIRFKLGNGISYKPDVVCFYFDGKVVCWEIKGPHAFRGGFENLKVAARTYPEIKWVLVWEENNRWLEQVVLP